MRGIESQQFVRMDPKHLAAMRANYAETFGVPIDCVKWRERKIRGVVRMHLFLARQKAKGGA